VSAGALTNRGYFDNVGDTRRRGVELNFEGGAAGGRLSWFTHYTWLQAQFEESFRVASPNNPAAIDGEIPVARGDRIPGVPQSLLQAGARLAVTDALSLSVGMKYQSDQFLRGDEGNLNAPLSGFTVVDVGAEWRVGANLTLFAQVDNLFDSRYATFGLYGSATEVLGEGFDDARFVSPAAPLSAWIGIRWTL
jgi:iron complex outermembrane recepter protein